MALSAPGGVGNVASDAILTTSDSGTTVPANDSSYTATTGTSIAAAHVTGVVSLMLSVRPTNTPAIIGEILKNTVRVFPTGPSSPCNVSLCGLGILDAGFATRAASIWGNATPQVFTRFYSNTGLRSDGQVFEWNIYAPTPVQKAGIGGVIKVVTGSFQSAANIRTLALRADGTVWAWGLNQQGQLGDGTTNPSTTPIRVPGLSGMTDIASGSAHSLAVKSDGTVWGWGYNGYGNLGDGTATQRLTPVQVPSLSGVVRVAAQAEHSLAVKSDGTVWGWGNNGYGQLGDGTTHTRSTPVQVTGLTIVVGISTDNDHSLAVKSDGTVWGWGYNYFGQLGDGTTTERLTPVQVTGLSGVVAVAAGSYNYSLALKSDGTVWAWGHNYNGQLGDGTTTDRLIPVQVSGLSAVIAIAAGNGASFAIKADGSTLTWGSYAELLPANVLGVGGVGTLNLNPLAGVFTPQAGVPLSSVRQSNPILLSGITDGSAITVMGGNYKIDAGMFTTAAGMVNNGQFVTLSQTALGNCGTTTTVTVTIAGVARGFNVTTIPCDTVPDIFALAITSGNRHAQERLDRRVAFVKILGQYLQTRVAVQPQS